MNYELAKKLKDAGFPVKKFGYAPDILEGDFVSPTLSELIEACGRKLTITDTGPNWRAWSHLDPESDCDGKTPEEAVANLWLKLKDSK